MIIALSLFILSFFKENRILYAPVAQWIEYWPPKPRVARSIRAGRTIFLTFLIF